MCQEERLVVGRISGFYGLKGYVKVFSETRPRYSILDFKTFLLQKGDQLIEVVVDDAKELSKNLVIKFKSFEDRTSVEPFLNAALLIYRSQLPKINANEYYWQDLIGMNVLSLEGKDYGVVHSLFETGANDVLVVQGDRGEVLIPFTLNHAVIQVNLEQRVITVDWDYDDL